MSAQFRLTWSQSFPESDYTIPMPFSRMFDDRHDAESVAMVLQHSDHVSDVELMGAAAPVWMRLEIPVAA